MDIEIVIDDRGQLNIWRGSPQRDRITRDIILDIVTDKQEVDSFFAVTADKEIFFGDDKLCG